jgi:hypothetical protein
MRNEILQFVKDHPRATFAMLEREFRAFKGDRPLSLARHPEIIYWDGMSEAAVQAIKALLRANKIHFKVSAASVYKMDGRALDLPITTGEDAEVSEPHWFPVTVSAGVQRSFERPIRKKR